MSELDEQFPPELLNLLLYEESEQTVDTDSDSETMDHQFKPPSGLSFEGNVAENWKRFSQNFKIYLTATGIEKKDDKVKIATLLHVAGEQAIQVFNSFKWNEEGDAEGDEEKYDKVIKKFKNFCEPRRNLTYIRYNFFTMSQRPDQSIDQYVTALRNQSRDCDFGGLQESVIKDRLIVGIRDDRSRKRLLREADLELDRAIDIIRAGETAALQFARLSINEGATISVSTMSNECQYHNIFLHHKRAITPTKFDVPENPCFMHIYPS